MSNKRNLMTEIDEMEEEMKKKLVTSVCICAITLISPVIPTTVFADEYDQLIQQKNNEVAELHQQYQSVQAQIVQLTNEVSGINEQAAELVLQQKTLVDEIADLEQEVTDLEARIEKRQVAIQNQARDTQVNGKSDHLISVLLDSESFGDFVQRLHGMTTIVSANNQMIQQQQADQAAVETKKNEAATKMAELQQMQGQLEAQKGELESKQADLNVMQTNLALQQATKETEKETLIAQKEAHEAEQARIREESERIAARQQAAAENQLVPTTTESSENSSISEVGSSETEHSAQGESTDVQGDIQETPTSSETSSVPAPDSSSPTASASNSNPDPQPAPVSKPTPPTPSAPSGNVGATIVAEAYKHLNKPYVWGAKGPDSFDCSGFTRYVYLQVTGKDIGGWTVAQETAGTVISVSQAQPGDLLFWGAAGSTNHVAISLGGNQYIHAPRPGQTVSVGNTAYYTPNFAVRVN
jgi:peptidoglycan hydrolase CwlO-like protein